jgi:hypothetical protein
MVMGDGGPEPMFDATIDSVASMDAAMMDAGPCPPEMVFVRAGDAGVCVDRYEGALVVSADGGSMAWPFFDPVDKVDAASIQAVPAQGIYPQGYISQVQATAACNRSGKRLCTLEEWTAACRGQPDHDYIYPYGDTYDPSACNEGRASPIVRLFPNPTYSYQELNDPRCDQLDGGLAHGGDFPKCKSSYGAFDMHGNLHEWIDDSPNGDPTRGSFMGGYFVDAKLNGPGCTYRTTAHAKTYHDYSTGFRCCADSK